MGIPLVCPGSVCGPTTHSCSTLANEEPGHTSYPDAAQEPDGIIHIVHDSLRTGGADGTGPKTVVYHRITEADIKAGRLISKGSALGRIANQATHRTLKPDEFDALKAGQNAVK